MGAPRRAHLLGGIAGAPDRQPAGAGRGHAALVAPPPDDHGAAVALPSLALATIGVVWLAGGASERPADPAASPGTVATAAPAPRLPDEITPVMLYQPPGPVCALLLGLVTLAQGDARQLGALAEGELLATPITAGAALATGPDGQLAVQLGSGTAFALGPSSQLAIARLDGATIELHVEGEVTVEVARRAPGQRFVVVAGGREVEVRGTAFSVTHRDGALEVACSHGLVAVAEPARPDEVVEVGAGRRWAIGADESLLDAVPAPMDAAGLTRLLAAQPAQLPAWTDAPSLLRTSGPLAIAAPAGRAVRVDGVVMGAGAVTMRVMSGRHLVEVERAPGRYGAARWVATRDDGRPTRVAAAVPEPRERGSSASSARRGQLEDQVDHRAMRGCLRGLAKQGLAAGTHVEVKIGVDETGAVTYLNLGDTDLPASTASCVRDVVARVRFAAGDAASWRHRFSF